jgi:hypothetical protein
MIHSKTKKKILIFQSRRPSRAGTMMWRHRLAAVVTAAVAPVQGTRAWHRRTGPYDIPDSGGVSV